MISNGCKASARHGDVSFAPRSRAWRSSVGAVRRSARACASASTADVEQASGPIAMPNSAQAQVTTASSAVVAAWKAGVRLQSVEILLPLTYATDLDDWPGGIRQQFFAAQPLVENLLKNVKKTEGLEGPLGAEMWDQGDAVGAWVGDKIAAVLFPTASVLKKLKALAADGSSQQLVIIINPQWENSGGVSDFGIGPWRAENEKFVSSFEPTFSFKSQRIYGDQLRVLKAYPSQWQIHVLDKRGGNEMIARQEIKPSYQEMEDILKARPESSMNKSIMDRMKDEWDFNQDSLKNGPQG